jgi:hypothetical protein
MSIRWLTILGVIFLLTACAKPPRQELDATEYLVARAYAYQAPTYAGDEYHAAFAALEDGRRLIAGRDYPAARAALAFARQHALRAYSTTDMAKAHEAAEEEIHRAAEAEARRKAEAEARRKAEEEARRKAEEEARRKAEEDVRKAATSAKPSEFLAACWAAISKPLGRKPAKRDFSASPRTARNLSLPIKKSLSTTPPGVQFPLCYQANSPLTPLLLFVYCIHF